MSSADPACHRNANSIQHNGAYRQTTSFVYLGGAITESSRLSAEIHRRIRAGWMSFNRYWAEWYDRSTASLDLKTRMVKSEVVEALLYDCAAWTPPTAAPLAPPH